jgi:hypothetical protein
LKEALQHPGAVLQSDAIKASKERVTAHNDAMTAAGAIQGTTAAAPTGSTTLAGTAPTPTTGTAPVAGTVAGTATTT